ncbi:hypothetical protein QUA00_31025 [Microcoleus sp. T2B6]|uniref:hypothetical protein n=1 Tax=unclassified Microcoleus TaxID=2642155 RepID=UPI002FCEC50F
MISQKWEPPESDAHPDGVLVLDADSVLALDEGWVLGVGLVLVLDAGWVLDAGSVLGEGWGLGEGWVLEAGSALDEGWGLDADWGWEPVMVLVLVMVTAMV